MPHAGIPLDNQWERWPRITYALLVQCWVGPEHSAAITCRQGSRLRRLGRRGERRVLAQPGRAGHWPAGPLTGVVRPFYCVLCVSAVQWEYISSGAADSNHSCSENDYVGSAHSAQSTVSLYEPATAPPTLEKPLRGDPGALGHCRELSPHHVFGDTAHAGRGVEAAIGAGHHASRVTDRSPRHGRGAHRAG